MTDPRSDAIPAQSDVPPEEVTGTDDSEFLTLHEAAALLDVHYMTVYRYVRTGRLPGERVGGIWRVNPKDVAVLRNGVPVAKGNAASKNSQEWKERFERQLMAGDEAGSWTVVQDALAGGMEPQDFHLTVLIPAMKSIGARWATGELSVAQEHQASAIAHRVVGRLGPRFAQRGRKRGHIVVVAPPGDRHSLPIAIFADLLRARRLRVSDLGADVPVHSLVEFVSHIPDLTAVGIGVTTPGNEGNVKNLIDATRQVTDVPIVVGGAAMQSENAAIRVGADAWSAPGEQGLQLFDSIGKLGVVPEEHRSMENHG